MKKGDGWKKVSAMVPDHRIINRAARKAKKLHKQHKIYVRGNHYEYLFEKVAGKESIVYRRRLKHYKKLTFIYNSISNLTERERDILISHIIIGAIVLFFNFALGFDSIMTNLIMSIFIIVFGLILFCWMGIIRDEPPVQSWGY